MSLFVFKQTHGLLTALNHEKTFMSAEGSIIQIVVQPNTLEKKYLVFISRIMKPDQGGGASAHTKHTDGT